MGALSKRRKTDDFRDRFGRPTRVPHKFLGGAMALAGPILGMAGSLFGGAGKGGSSSSSSSSHSVQKQEYDPAYTDLLHKVIGKASDLGDSTYQPYDPSKRFEDFTPDQLAAQQQVREMQGKTDPYTGAAKGALDRVAGYDPTQAAQPWMQRAFGQPTALAAGAPWLQAGSGGWDRGAQRQYSNDFAEGAIGRANDISSRNFLEKTMPGINDQFVKSGGGLGRGRYTEFMNRAVRDLGNEMSGNAQTTMANNYWQGANQFNTDQSRLQNTGMNMGNLANSSMTGALSGAGQASSAASAGITGGTNLAGAYTGAGQGMQNMGFQQVNALGTSGAAQQAQGQRARDFDYQQFNEAKRYPFEMVNFMRDSTAGMRIPGTLTTDSTGTQSGQQTPATGSPFAQALGGAAAGAGLFGNPSTSGSLSNTIGGWLGGLGGSGGGGIDKEIAGWSQYGKARGGAVRRYAMGGQAFPAVVEPRMVASPMTRDRATPALGALGARGKRRKFSAGGYAATAKGVNQDNQREVQASVAKRGALGGGPNMAPPPMMRRGALGLGA